jgi:hypothetical protein
MSKAIDYQRHIDPEYRRWGRKYPRFPGVGECVRLLRSGNVPGAWIDIICYELTAHAKECLPELIGVFRSDEGEWMRLMVLSSIADARLPEAIPFLAEVVREGHASFVPSAASGLSSIGTKDARTALWEATHA